MACNDENLGIPHCALVQMSGPYCGALWATQIFRSMLLKLRGKLQAHVHTSGNNCHQTSQLSSLRKLFRVVASENFLASALSVLFLLFFSRDGIIVATRSKIVLL